MDRPQCEGKMEYVRLIIMNKVIISLHTSILCFMQSLMLCWTSQASLPILEHVDLPSTIMPLPTSPLFDGGNNNPLPICGPMQALIATVASRPPPPLSDPLESIPDSPPPSPVASIPSHMLPNVAGCSSQPEPCGMESSPQSQVERPQVDLPPSTSVVDVIPTDPTSPEAVKIVPKSVKRYLQRWPLGDSIVDPRFDNTTLHDFQTMHNNQDEDKRRAALIDNVPSHVHVSFPTSMTTSRCLHCISM